MNRSRPTNACKRFVANRGARFFFVLTSACLALLSFGQFAEVWARVGGGSSYSGGKGGGSGSGDGGAIIAIFRFLIYMTVEYPAIGIPLHNIVISFLVHRLLRKKNRPFA